VLIMGPPQWRARQAAHQDRVDAWIRPFLARRERGRGHPVEDFLFTYYPHRPARLRRWHPGAGVALVGADEHLSYPGYAVLGSPPADSARHRHRADGPDSADGAGGRLVTADPARASRPDGYERTLRLLRRTAGRAAYTGCFGLHEWAMVYRIPADSVRHAGHPMRLRVGEIAELVESLPVRCTHFDAYRFFTPAARPLNRLRPTRAGQPDLEQPGCLHANMDLYKWAYLGTPYVASSLVADCFALAREIRAVDMRASPYDLSELGYEPIPIETAAGRAAYVALQREFAERAWPLRQALITAYELIQAAGPARSSVTSSGWESELPAGTARRTGDPERAHAGRAGRARAGGDRAPG
jgi:hypothetical protein